jgi:hypothetical protein
LNDEQGEAALRFVDHAETIVQSGTAIAILIRIVRETLAKGESRTSHSEHGVRTGRCRRTIDGAFKTLKKHSLITRIGTTDRGVAIYRANIDAGA